MTIEERKIAASIWPDKMPDPYADKVARAKRWLGKRYLLAEPVRRPTSKPLPVFLMRQAG